MQLEAGWFDLVAGGLAAAALLHLAGIVAALASPRRQPLVLVSASVLATGVTAVHGISTVVAWAALAAAVLVLRWVGPFSTVGAAILVGVCGLAAFAVPWGVWFLTSIPVGPLTRALLLAPLPVAALVLPIALVRQYENVEVLCRRRWQRPHAALPGLPAGRVPRVSIHVPAHAEPPEMVIETLDALAGLDYPAYEVLVIDNNTSDESLWRPVEEHCRILGPRFRFVHVEGLEGAKAGALNLALSLTDPAAELVAVVDADYVAEPFFLSSTVGYFGDPAMGFIQSPHAYRGWERNRFLRMCRWEYSYFYATGMRSLNERDAALTVGTMCVIRKQALVDAGGWATWCLTEDSELSIRIHSLGYSSVYLTTVLGRGLIPETFHGYRKQRFRWTYGPVQEFYRHYRRFLHRAAAVPTLLSTGQKVHHAVHGLHGAVIAVSALLLPFGAAAATSMVVHGEQVPLPLPVWVAMTASVASGVLQRWAVYRGLGANLGDFVGASIASLALACTIVVANLAALLARPTAWQRTNKFQPTPQGFATVFTATGELVAAGLAATAAAALLVATPGGIATMLAVGLALQALALATAPAVALVAERSLKPPVVDESHQPVQLAG